MMLRVTKAIGDIARKYFEILLLAGAFPEVKFEKGASFTSFSLLDYSDWHARYMKLLDTRIKAEMLDSLGIFTRKRSATFLKEIETMARIITEADIRRQPDRFHSFADDIRSEAMRE